MKKILLSVAMLAACGMATAQKLTYVPYANNSVLQGTVTSANGRYVAGGTGEYAFICDMTTLETKTFIADELGANTDETQTSDIWGVTDDGIGYGEIGDQAAKFDFANGTMEKLVETGNSLAKWTTADGKVQVGVTYNDGFYQVPVIWEDGNMTELPAPTEATMGFELNGVKTVATNSDASIIIGAALDNFDGQPLLVWNRNADGKTYSVVPVCKRFYNGAIEGGWQPYDYFEGAAISDNGKWIALNYHRYDETFEDETNAMRLARYDVEADTLQFIDCPDANMDTWYYANGIANDGTIIGYVEDQNNNGRLAMICQSGSTQAKYMKDVYPGVKELADMDALELNSPCSITPDGRYVMGYGYVESPQDSDDAWYATWQLDRGEQSTGVEETTADNAPKKVVASYDLEGKKLNLKNGKRGIVINRLSNGKTVKNLVK